MCPLYITYIILGQRNTERLDYIQRWEHMATINFYCILNCMLYFCLNVFLLLFSMQLVL